MIVLAILFSFVLFALLRHRTNQQLESLRLELIKSKEIMLEHSQGTNKVETSIIEALRLLSDDYYAYKDQTAKYMTTTTSILESLYKQSGSSTTSTKKKKGSSKPN